MDSVAKKLLVALALPALLVAVTGMTVLWRQTDQAARTTHERDAESFARFLAAAFATPDDTAVEAREPSSPAAPARPARAAHRAVTHVMRNDWSALRHIAQVRILGADGTVRWSRRVEEEDRAFPDAARLLQAPPQAVRVEGPSGPWPWSKRAPQEIVVPLGAISCAQCHAGETALRTGVLQLTLDESSLRREMAASFTSALGSVVFFGLALSAAVALSLHFFLSRPLARLAGLMQRAEAGEWLVRAPAMGSDEIGRLAMAFNRMLARLTELKVIEIEQQRDLDRAHGELALKERVERLNEHLQVRVAELQILYELARTINATLDLGEVLERVTASVPRLGIPKFSVMLLGAPGLLEIRKAHPSGQGSEGLTFAVGEGVCGAAASRRESVYVSDLEESDLFRARRSPGARGRGSLLAVPMLHGGELLGVLNFERSEKADFSPDDIDFLTAVTDQIATAVANARLHDRAVALAVTDALTGIPNRRHLGQQLDAELHRAARFGYALAVLMIDVDHFKHLNDTAGHAAGDEVLRRVSELLLRTLRKVDTLARYGGEEFTVLLPKATRTEALEVAEKLRRAVAEAPLPHAAAQPGKALTVSIGVAVFPDDGRTQAALLERADTALYAAKRAGRNGVRAYAVGMEHRPSREPQPPPVDDVTVQ